MLSGRLIHLVEVHYRELTDRLIREIWRHPDLVHLRRLPESELRDRAQVLLENFGFWLSSGNEQQMGQEEEAMGTARFSQGVPLHEVLRALCLIKYNLVEFIEEEGLPRDPLGLYAEEELEHRIGRFFDILMIRSAQGYETAWHRAVVHAAAE